MITIITNDSEVNMQAIIYLALSTYNVKFSCMNSTDVFVVS